jgi:hypothetical protein
MKKKTIGIITCMLLLAPAVVMTTAAEPTFDVKISGGIGVNVNITNTGEETENGQIVWCEYTDYKFVHEAEGGPPGIGGSGIHNLAPGKSETYHWLALSEWVHVFPKSPLQFKTPISFCTITVKVYENGGNNTIYGQESVDVLRILPFIILLE